MQKNPLVSCTVLSYNSSKTIIETLESIKTQTYKKAIVTLKDGDKIEFFGNGDWKEIQCKTTLVPEALIPAPILDYVKTNYPEAGITEIECKKRGYEISLTNRLEIEFNKQFVVIDIDD